MDLFISKIIEEMRGLSVYEGTGAAVYAGTGHVSRATRSCPSFHVRSMGW